MFVRTQITDPALKSCPFCNTSVILVSTVSYQKGEDDGYKVGCQCGWAGRLLRKWYSNKNKLIEDWNDHILEAEI